MITNPGPLPVEYLEALGRVVVLSGQLEHELTGILARIVGGHRNAVEALIDGDSFSMKVDKLRVLVSRQIRLNGVKVEGALNRAVPDDFAEMLSRVATACEAARTARNDAVHGRWGRTSDGQIVCVTVKTRPVYKLDEAIVSLAELQATVDLLEAAFMAAQAAAYDQVSGELNVWGAAP